MVKRDKTSSISENDESITINENGKRPLDTENKDGQKKLRIRGLYRQPTVEELNRLQETENLFNSNLFRLQIDEILNEVKVKEKTVKRFQEWFNTLKEHLKTIPEGDTEYDLTEDKIYKHLGVKSPVGIELNKTKCMFKFHKFQDINIVGSYGLGNSINSKLIIDTQITVPMDTYTKNDSINYRYHKKRAAYLACIASHLKDLEIIEELKYMYVNDCHTKPMLEIKPSGKLSNILVVRMNLSCDPESYKLHRFSPVRNNLRESWLFDDKVENSSDVGPPTPYYNSSILSDLTNALNQDFLNETFLNRDNLKQAVVLLKIWLRQRKLQVSGYVISVFVAYLVQIKRINNIMSSYQIIRNVWIYIKSSELDTKGISLFKGSASVPSIEEFHQSFPVVFIDKSGFYNICWDMHKGTYNALKRESALAIEMLDNPNINSFIPLFMTPMHELLKFDHIIRFKNLKSLNEKVYNKVPRSSQVNYGIHRLALVTETVYSVLSRGLGDRADLVLQLVQADLSWSVKKSVDKVKQKCEDKLSFGLVLNSENVIKIVDKGPPANLPESEEFRSFWGEKSELRRFQDGSITEAVVWEADSRAQRRALPKQIVNYLLNFKYGVPSSEVYQVSDQLDQLVVSKSSAQYIEEGSTEVLRAFDELRRDLRALNNLPLDVTAMYGTSSVFSYCRPVVSVCAGRGLTQPHPRRRAASALIKDTPNARPPAYTQHNTVVLELGHSGKWPGDLQAFRCLKAAFHLQISERLSQQFSLPVQAYPTHIDVLKNGLVFRLKIAHPKEITLLQREMENGVVKHRESEEAVMLQRETVLLPRVRGALHGLHQKYPAYGPAACLMKRWLSAHLLSPPHFPSILADLVTAAVFLRPAPLEPPVQPLAGFLRALRILVDTDWSREMILLDFNNDMSREEITEVERQFNETDERGVMYIVTSYDGDFPSIWSRQAPTKQALLRVTTIASATLNYLEKALIDEYKDNILGVFVPSLSGYDALIHLATPLVPHTCERVGHAPERAHHAHNNRNKADDVLDDVVPVVDFNPVAKYLHELRSAYSEFALFFNDCYGGDVIAVLWRPDIDRLKDFQIANANGLMPVETDGETKYKVNKQALLQDFRILGRGLVLDITVT
ncbi:PREDICTED: nucleolar protein 6 [Papilio xuthus]|uniref:Nucleolar protein 6 n=1 Tax=Papilio xuthus TaxID=66420 RepID=A0AAJ6ZK67_PAPXU|nr:PREDICTED: nucleolar protein 6 [Papilio xuthus]